MRRIVLYLICMAVFFSSQICVAEFYQYTNAAGILIFTDDLSQVPVDQRTKMTSHGSVKKKEMGADEEKSRDSASTSIDGKRDTENIDLKNSEKDRNWFKEEEKRLNREKNTLLALKEDINTPKKQEDYNGRVRALNQAIETYKKKLKQFNKGVTP